MTTRTWWPVGLAAALLALVSSTASPAQSAAQTAQITVLAATSLTNVFPRVDASPKYSFGGSDTLAAQIRLGAPADVFAAANSSIPDKLYAQGLLEEPVVFTTNKLVLVVPRSNPAGITSVFDLRKPGIKLIVGTPTVPIGSYTRSILKNLALTSVLANVVSQETDVRSILGKVALGEADAGFVYVTDARAAASQITSIPIPTFAQPKVRYEIAVVTASTNKAAANAFIKRVKSPRGKLIMAQAGFKFPKPRVRKAKVKHEPAAAR